MRFVFGLLMISTWWAASAGTGAAQTKQKLPFECKVDTDDVDELKSLLNNAITEHKLSCVRQILKKGISPTSLIRNTQGSSPIELAAFKGNGEIVDALVKAGLDVESREAANALVAVALHGGIDVMRILLAAGVSPDGENDSRLTALSAVAGLGLNDAFDLLIANGAELNAKTKEGKTALMLATDNPRIVLALIKKGARINETDQNGRTALFYAIENHEVAKLEVLLKNGADLNIKDKDGQTPMQLASTIKDAALKLEITGLLNTYATK